VTSTATKAPKPLSEILSESAKKGLGGGLPGMAAMVLQVGSLMWLRTTINYQYRHGTSTSVALRTLYREGGVLRCVESKMSNFCRSAKNLLFFLSLFV
jgi:hypothetical protein